MRRCPYHQTVLDPAAAEHPRSGAADAGQGDGRTAGARFVAVHKIIEGLPPAGYRLSWQGIPGQNGRRAAGIGRIGIQRQPGRSDERAVRRVMRTVQSPRADVVGEGGFSLLLCFGDTSGADEGEESNKGQEFEMGHGVGMKKSRNIIMRVALRPHGTMEACRSKEHMTASLYCRMRTGILFLLTSLPRRCWAGPAPHCFYAGFLFNMVRPHTVRMDDLRQFLVRLIVQLLYTHRFS